jgi:hypothetical protein
MFRDPLEEDKLFILQILFVSPLETETGNDFHVPVSWLFRGRKKNLYFLTSFFSSFLNRKQGMALTFPMFRNPLEEDKFFIFQILFTSSFRNRNGERFFAFPFRSSFGGGKKIFYLTNIIRFVPGSFPLCNP